MPDGRARRLNTDTCGDCGLLRIAYNSCLTGRSSNGELACRCRHFPVNCSRSSYSHNSAVLYGDENVGDLLLDIEAVGASAKRGKGTILDGFAPALERQGYSAGTACDICGLQRTSAMSVARQGHCRAARGIRSQENQQPLSTIHADPLG